LLLPILSVVVLAILLASATSAYLDGSRARRQEEENLRRVVGTLVEATFPLTPRVLQQMRGFSGAEFVLLDAKNRLQIGTVPLEPKEIEPLAQAREGDRNGRFSAGPRVMLAGKSYLVDRLSVAGRDARTPGLLIVLYPEDRWSATVRQAMYPALVAGVVAATAVVLVTTVLARRFVRPIQRLGDQTASIAAGQFKPVAVARRDDEIRDLALSINQMAEKLSRYENEVRRNERLQTLGQLGAGMVHQLRNAATGAAMAIELHRQECPLGDACESLEVALRQLRLMESYLQRFLALGRSRAVSHEPVALETVVEDVLGLVRPTCSHARIDLAFRNLAGPIQVRGEPEALRQLLVNLLLNAVEAVGVTVHGDCPDFRGEARENGTVPFGPERLAPKVVVDLDRSGTALAVVRVRDSGPGPPDAIRDELFEPFVTEKPDGTGLGLYVARQIAEAHQGVLRWERRDGMTCFCVELPILETTSDHGPPSDR
jgi:signal transduction histidine kinase